jgi:hypothetical protein
MADLLKSAWQWLQGKKTFGAAAMILLAAAYGYWTGYLPPQLTLLVMGAAFALVGLADKADRYGALALAVLDQLKAAQEEKEAKQKPPIEEQLRTAFRREGKS